ncbi:MAG: HAMP domain-containing sensor histidine kinase [Lachnospiraceae bacterium]|nr:HAMP domain-containing sensor histidine kinase [Lachnospiraceae bacterium]
MKRLWYQTGYKSAGIALQGLLAGIITLCLLNIGYWTEGSLGVTEMGKSYEETSVFLQLVTDTVNEKISYEQNKELFEQNDQYDELKEIDIQQYVEGTADDVNLNTTYYIRDLLEFYETGGQKILAARITELQARGISDQEMGELLDEDAGTLETVLPISGSSLSEYSRLNPNPSISLLGFYQELSETSQEIYQRYKAYQLSQAETGGEGNSEAPSNIRYYIENTGTKERYTNLGVKSFTGAQRMIQNSDELNFLYEGERSFNIMVANTEHVLSDTAAQWFINMRFLGPGERVILAVDRSYSIGDELQQGFYAYEQREPVLFASVAGGAISLLGLLALLIISIVTAGRKEEKGPLELNGFDQIPTEIAAGLCLITGIIWYLLVVQIKERYLYTYFFSQLLMLVAVTVEYWIFLFSVLSLVRRIKARMLWRNSVSYAVALGCRQVYSAKQTSQRLLIGYILFFALNFFFLRFFGVTGIFLVLVMDMAVLLYLMRDVVGKQSVREGLSQIAKGRLNYKIDTSVLTGEALEMAAAVNEMGDGLAKAVDAIVKNERLKAELITNVSHDIKTPLTSIINYVDLLQRENLQNEKAREYIDVLNHKSQRLKQLTEDLLEASRINSGNVELQIIELKLHQLLQQAYGEFAERMEENKLEMELSIPKAPVLIQADGRQLWRVFENLLGNMVKYSKPETRVSLKLQAEGQLAVVTFRNQMKQKLNISAQELQERFVRGDLSRNTEGSGLGLSIAKSLTELMNGTFEVSLEEDFFIVTLNFECKNNEGVTSKN